jgi:hypothetical protein
MAKASLLSKLGAMSGTSGDRLAGMRLYDGIRVDKAFLGRKDFLPKVSVSARGKLSLLAEKADLHAEVELVRVANGEFALESNDTLDGLVTLRLEEAPVEGVDALVSQRAVRFVPEAIEHAQLREADPSRWTDVEEIAVEPASEGRFSESPSILECARTPMSEPMRDLSEALYARGGAGWSEADLVALVNRTTGGEGPSAWDVLRTLQEAGWLRATIASAWRVRRWWLRPPEVAEVATRAVLVGSAPEALRRRFAATASEAGGRVWEMDAPGTFSITPLVAEGVDLGELVEELRWPIATLPGQPRSRAPICWPATNQEPSRHEPASVWNMSSGRFEPVGAFKQPPVELVRHRREAGDRPDLFTVRGSRGDEVPWVTLSRTAAVLEAYRRARLPMFETSGPWLVRLANDGYLPLPLAQAAVLRTGRVSGPYLDGQRWTYAYPLDDTLLQDIRLVLGDAIVFDARVGLGASNSNRNSSYAIGRARARFGSRR